MDCQLVRAGQGYRVAVPAVEVGDRAASLDSAWLAGDGDHVFDNDVLCQEVEEVLPIDQAREALLDDPEERVEGREILGVVLAWWPVTFSMSSLGVEPWPVRMVAVSHRSITA